MVEVIHLKKKKTGIAAYREKKGILPKAVKILTSPKTTIALGATLAGLLTAGAAAPAATGAALRATPGVLARGTARAGKAIMPKTAKGALKAAIIVPTAAGVFTSSKKARTVAKKAIDPRESFKRGETIAEIIEDPSKTADVLGIKEKQSLKEKVITGLKAAGLVGAAAAVTVGGAAALKKGKAILDKRKAAAQKPVELKPSMRELGFTEPKPVGLGGIPVKQPKSSLIGAPQSTKTQPPVSNIIQIQVQ